MSARDVVLNSIRRSLGVSGGEAPRRTATDERIARHPRGLVPQRGSEPAKKRLKQFTDMVAEAHGTVQELVSPEEVPGAVSAYLRSKNLPMSVRRGSDPRLNEIPWQNEGTLEVTVGPSDGKQLASVSHAFGAVAETGTIVLVSGPENPTTLNFLPEHHLVVVAAKDIAGNYESVWDALRKKGAQWPRTVNWITGPSRSADIEQVHLHGAHGPRSLHVLIVGKA
ncbi:MAG TPA: LUD domain-containing protein [Xanthobacteraceae bacterium]|jgi:L-lactate dehydrogenase complex protein LldG